MCVCVCLLQCSEDCDQERTVVCVNSNGEEVHAQYCSHLSPRSSTVQSCSVGSCSMACFWSTTKWSKVSSIVTNESLKFDIVDTHTHTHTHTHTVF